jgi:hypothetical protein
MVAARYLSALIPLWLFGISIALVELGEKVIQRLIGERRGTSIIRSILLIGLLFGLLWQGPIRIAYRFPNGFTNHMDFQYNYLRSNTRIGVYPASDCPMFYSHLGKRCKACTIIEFPGVVSWSYNPYHIYQRLHESRVLLGYSSLLFGPFFGYEPPTGRENRFRNIVDLSSVSDIYRSGAGFVIVHKNIYDEAMAVRQRVVPTQRQIGWQPPSSIASIREKMQTYVLQVRKGLEENFGEPAFEDGRIAVYRVTTVSGSTIKTASSTLK